MGTNILGWVEINTQKQSSEDIWFKVIDIDVVVEQDYKIFARLFGVRALPDIVSVAADRGLPQGVADTQTLLHESIVGVSWASYEEIAQPLSDLCKEPFTQGWHFVLQAMCSLQHMFGNGNVRLVVGFDNYG